MLEISKIAKTYANGVRALDGVDLRIGSGMFGLLGPNGAGKSSLMRTIATLQEPDSGSIHFGEINVLADKGRMRSVLGYLPQEFGVYPTSSAEDLLDHLALLKGLDKRRERREAVDQLLVMTNLERHRKKSLGGFSGGMKQRFGIAQALLGQPQLIIVDEPTAGLDPEERDRFHNLLSQIGENRTVILSTHIVSDVSDLCSQMAIVHEGRVRLNNSPRVACEQIQGLVWKTIVGKNEADRIADQNKVLSKRLTQGEVMLRVFSPDRPGPDFEKAAADLEDVYFAVVRGFYQ